MIRTVIFDLGGVIITIDHEEAKRRFKALGLKNVDEIMNPYTQNGIFGDLEAGRLTAEEYIYELGKLVERHLGWDEVKQCWLGYLKEVPRRNLDLLNQLRQKGYRVILLSNTNPFMQEWAESGDFDGIGNGISSYFDALYRSYEVKMLKPEEGFFRYVLSEEDIIPEETLFVDDGPRNVAAASELGIHTYCPENGKDWTHDILDYIK